MSDLRDLAQSVQQAIDAPPFDKLARRATRRRRRKTAFATAGVIGIVATIVSLVVLPGGSAEPAASPEEEGRALVQSADAQLQGTLMISENQWAASWADCRGSCRYGAVLSRNGRSWYLPVKTQPYVLLQVGNEPVAVSGREPMSPAGDRPEQSLARLTNRGLVRTLLRYVAPTQTFATDEVLTDKFGPESLQVLNLKDSTLRPLTTPPMDEILSPSAPVRDKTGRWWTLSGRTRIKVAWTDNRGISWRSEPVDVESSPGNLAVSPNGRTTAATSLTPLTGNTFVSIANLKVSTDAGQSWRLFTKPGGHSAGPVTLDDGTVLLLGQLPGDPTRGLYTVTGRQVQRLNDAPDLTNFTGNSNLLYGLTIEPMTTKVAFSTDRGTTWNYFEPR
ncbi:hypothetical protein GCM10029976_044470 [Kribbella albertanoniae]|uniref:Exo-alpha-sialidase n=1 Tax=Kribbella albertanoniae TaxID=1266829 RepID=A0A4R4Q9G7_9ACTN|nr:sialidase family protein [Kribbella albertanoniae]TDC32011.1 exo-alpha-sialidase [Kribbella albertanoniae]